ncbi:MAG TPA: glycosyltransferase family 39 protein, partial [Dehalococcoidia bacterium]|nr:glycosyltransferase family 39 protein [Dehalococcoidia bacterium]
MTILAPVADERPGDDVARVRTGAPRSPAGATWLRGTTALLLLIGGFKLALHLATNGLYGYHRDELFYLAAGGHLAFGYVDYGPVTPLLARADVLLLGNSPWALRLFPALAGAGIVMLAGLVARELGGGRGAQVLAAVLALASPMLLGANWMFEYVTFDQLAWMVVLLLATRALRRDEPRLWLAVGVVAGIGLETKLTIAALGIGLMVALLVAPGRRHLRTPWPWAGGAIALAIFAPNVAWQALHGWPVLSYIRVHGAGIQQDGPIPFLLYQPLVIGVLSVPVWLAGWYHLFRERDLRPLGAACAVAFLLFVPIGKYYYPGPLIPFVLAAGSVRVASLAARGGQLRRLVPAAGGAALVSTAIISPIVLPIVPPPSMTRFHLDTIRKDFADTVGWRELAAQVETIASGLPAAERGRAVVLA